ncbi:cytochrome d ubiquinol oxidase subunit II [Catellatospora sp. KI3]|uniref:cytochrome d ubiquinol oxidase subunit II n=1 Tax=Catellatospora sp. KI3 TaxID=3041620 RepID=UPI002482E5E0|nr:cytochrome d ubiquinol oxidase subunit II [Catellatospora sp. KI3]MDI1463977.1 cytochrome d ubiquinol oxidase subunit II [Catellatospora sp. KI3]
MSAADGVAAVLVLVITLYAWSGLADYGAGFWDLLAGDRATGRRPRQLIDAAVTPIWEANHVWLVFILVVAWTAFGIAFASIMTTLYIPLFLAALGIVLRGASFALRKDAAREGRRHVAGWLFGLGSILTPFCFGTVLGALAAGRVPVGNAAGNEITSWWNPVSILTGVLAVASGAFLSAVYLVAEARRRDLPDLERYFWTRAIAAGAVGLVAGAAAAIALHGDNPQMFDRLVSRSIPLLLIGVIALAATMYLARRAVVRGLRVVAAVGVAALIWSWAVAQAPYLLPFTLTIDDGAGAAPTLRWVLIWTVIALLAIIPALALLYSLDQRSTDLGEDPATARPETDLSR